MIDITEIVLAVLGLLGLIVTTVLVPWIKSKMTNEQWQMIVNYAYAGVQAAEIIFNAQGQPTILSSSVLRMASRLTAILLK